MTEASPPEIGELLKNGAAMQPGKALFTYLAFDGGDPRTGAQRRVGRQLLLKTGDHRCGGENRAGPAVHGYSIEPVVMTAQRGTRRRDGDGACQQRAEKCRRERGIGRIEKKHGPALEPCPLQPGRHGARLAVKLAIADAPWIAPIERQIGEQRLAGLHRRAVLQEVADLGRRRLGHRVSQGVTIGPSASYPYRSR
jgi:hypothetical protein